jgi:hypothetical protein
MGSGNCDSLVEGMGSVEARDTAGGASRTAERDGDCAADAGADGSGIVSA